MGILSGYLGLEFFKHCYTPMGEIMDLLTLLVRKRPALRLGMHFELLLNYLNYFYIKKYLVVNSH